MTSPTLQQLRIMVSEHFGVPEDKLDNQVSFTELGLDSLTLVEFMFAIEDHYDIGVDHASAMADPTLNGLAKLVDQLNAEKTALAA